MTMNRTVCPSLATGLFAGVSMAMLAWVSTISVAISRADNADDALNALMMGGTGMPTPSEEWRDTIIADYIDPATRGPVRSGPGPHTGIGLQYVDSDRFGGPPARDG